MNILVFRMSTLYIHCYNTQTATHLGLERAKTRIQEFPPALSCRCRDPTWVIIYCFPRYVRKELDYKWSRWVPQQHMYIVLESLLAAHLDPLQHWSLIQQFWRILLELLFLLVVFTLSFPTLLLSLFYITLLFYIIFPYVLAFPNTPFPIPTPITLIYPILLQKYNSS